MLLVLLRHRGPLRVAFSVHVDIKDLGTNEQHYVVAYNPDQHFVAGVVSGLVGRPVYLQAVS